MTPMQAPRLNTPRLLLKPLELADATAMLAYRADPAVGRYQRWRPGTEEEVKVFIETHGKGAIIEVDSWCQLGVYLPATRELIGDVGLHVLPPDARQIELGFSISPRHQRQGYAFEAVGALLRYLLTNVDIHRITASVDPKNTASVGLLEKLGMRKEAHHLQSVWTPEGWADDLIYAILREEWTIKSTQKE